MKYDNIVVSNVILPYFRMKQTEHANLITTRICRKSPSGYIDLETNRHYSDKQQLGIDRVDKNSIVSLNEYYNCLGFKKKNDHENKEEVYQKVRKLKKQRKI